MIYLFWVYIFGEIIVSLFLGALIFLKTESLAALGLYAALRYVGILLGFVVWGFVCSKRKISMRRTYFFSFVLYILSFIILLILPNTYPVYLLFSALSGVAAGMFWLAIHTYELLHIQDQERDFYSSMLSLGAQILGIVAPLISTMAFFAAEHIFQVRPFLFLFALLPIIYAAALKIVYRLPDFVPPTITRRDIKELRKSKRITPVRKFYVIQTMPFVSQVIMPMVSILTFVTLINLGLFQTIMGIISLATITLLAHLRHTGNRAHILFWAALAHIGANVLLFFWNVHVAYFILYSLALIVIGPIYRVSQHTIDLKSIDILGENISSFYPAMLYRDVLLNISRIIFIGGFTLTALFMRNDFLMIQIGIGFLILTGLLEWWAAKKMLAT